MSLENRRSPPPCAVHLWPASFHSHSGAQTKFRSRRARAKRCYGYAGMAQLVRQRERGTSAGPANTAQMMNDMMSGMAIWWIAGALLVVVLVIAKLLKKG